MERFEYTLNPHLCELCKKPLTWLQHWRNKFCSHACSSRVNNRGVRRHGRAPSTCQNCGARCRSCRNKFCSIQCSSEGRKQQKIEAWQAGLISGVGKEAGTVVSLFVRKYLFKKYGARCTQCGWAETNVYTNKIPLEVDHIDGNWQNCCEENLRLLCPNCHSLTSNYGSRNKGKGRPGFYKAKWLKTFQTS